LQWQCLLKDTIWQQKKNFKQVYNSTNVQSSGFLRILKFSAQPAQRLGDQSTHQINKSFWCLSNILDMTLLCSWCCQSYLRKVCTVQTRFNKFSFNVCQYESIRNWEKKLFPWEGLDWFRPENLHLKDTSTSLKNQWGLFCAVSSPVQASLYYTLHISFRLIGI